MDDPLAALDDLGSFAAGLAWDDVPAAVQARLAMVLLDHLAVTMAGHGTPEGGRLVATVDPSDGPAPIPGTGRSGSVEQAAWLNGVAGCGLELDEGNKYARGHPAAHVAPIALARAAEARVTGQELAAALLAGYEVAARAGAATRLHPGVHPHGNWGALGAAAAVARLAGDDAATTTAAIGAAGGLVLATPFATVLAGNRVRDAWIAHANLAGLHARSLAAAGLATATATVDHTLGGLLGELDEAVLADDLGERWTVTEGYFKQHASCSYTHPPADAVLELREDVDPDAVRAVRVRTHHLAAGLAALRRDDRLGAMFSIPWVVGVALVHGDCAPARFSDAGRRDSTVARVAERVAVVHDPALDDRLPAERVAIVEVELEDGTTRRVEAPNPVGDADHHPFDRDRLERKARDLLDPLGLDVAVLVGVVDELFQADDVAPVLARLPGPPDVATTVPPNPVP
ncbi:MmgE/PrpD family protein [Salsipaludibacter albus]|uniref:MmgE/PrpD family protein n=1 Tax=Salsipaludibacter albus TaxID=2849650 RepID=UPI001EE456D6|nr:MmgE/PrpD family protein [Salsipaludibacter albus]MBY5162125.1 MmgE/PrpD family protein [Salsipaludibacter albus]